MSVLRSDEGGKRLDRIDDALEANRVEEVERVLRPG
jgi:hypothetical protein